MYILSMLYTNINGFCYHTVNSGLHCNSGGPPLPRDQKAIDTYPIFTYELRDIIFALSSRV